MKMLITLFVLLFSITSNANEVVQPTDEALNKDLNYRLDEQTSNKNRNVASDENVSDNDKEREVASDQEDQDNKIQFWSY